MQGGRRWVSAVVAEPTAARRQRPLCPGGHRAGRLPQRGILKEPAGANCPRRARPPARLRCLHLPPAPPQAPVDRPGGDRHLVAWPASERRLGPRRSLVPGSRPLRRAPGAWGGAAAHLVESRTPGQGVGPAFKPLIPGFGASGSQGGADGSGFPRSPANHAPPQPSPARPLASPPRVYRGVAARGLASREREGAWLIGFSLKWLRVCAPNKRKGNAVVGRLYLSRCDRPGRTGPDTELDSGWSIALSSLTLLAAREFPDPPS